MNPATAADSALVWTDMPDAILVRAHQRARITKA